MSANGEDHGPARAEWLVGLPMNPAGTPAEPLTTIAGFPFLHPGCGVVIVGPIGGGRSSLIQAGLYDAAKAGLRSAYLGHEVTKEEFDARAAKLAETRGDEVDDELRAALAQVRYLELTNVVGYAWEDPEAWVAGIQSSYQIVAFDPLSAVESAIELNFEQRNNEFIRLRQARTASRIPRRHSHSRRQHRPRRRSEEPRQRGQRQVRPRRPDVLMRAGASRVGDQSAEG